MHSQLFYPSSNEDGYVSVICHRERYLKELLAMGWFETADEAIAMLEPKCPGGNGDCGARKSNGFAHSQACLAEHEAAYSGHEVDPNSLSVGPNGYPDVAIHEPMPVEMPPGYTGERAGIDGLTKSQRKKLRLNK